MNLKVEAGAMILGPDSFRPMHGAKGAINSQGRLSILVASGSGCLNGLTEIGQIPCSRCSALRQFLDFEQRI